MLRDILEIEVEKKGVSRRKNTILLIDNKKMRNYTKKVYPRLGLVPPS